MIESVRAIDLVKREGLHRLLLWAVALGTAGSGLLNIYSVIGDSLPARTQLLERVFPLAFLHLSRSLTLLIGFALVVSSINIYRRKRRAFRLVLCLSLFSVAFHLAKGIDYEEASASLLLFFTLLLTRSHFNVKSGPPDLRQAVIRAVVGVLIVFCYGVAGFWLLEESEFGVNFHIADALKRTLLIISLAGDPQLAPQTSYARWFAGSVYLLTFAAIVYAGLAFFRPIIYRLRTLPHERLQAARILRGWGRSSLDFFKLWPDKSYYFNEAGNCFIAYSVGNNYAMALADPTGPPECLEETVRGFLEFCRANDWGVAFHQALPDFLSVYHKLGLKHLKIGDEAVVDLPRFSLDGRRRKKLRSNVQKFESSGFRIMEYQPPIPEEILREARRVSDDWLSLPGRRERQFSLGIFEEEYLSSTPLYTLVDARGQMVAFFNRIESYRRGEATIDLMRHLAEAPNGTMDYLFTKLFLDCQEKGFERFGLGMAPLDGFQESEQPSPEERAVHYFMGRLNFFFSYSGLRHYKAKFADAWEPRYLVYQNIPALPQVALALAKVSELRRARVKLISATLKAGRNRKDAPLTTKPSKAISRLRRVMISLVVLIALGAAYATTRTRPLPPAGKNALVIRGQQQDVYFYPAQGGVKNAQKVLFLCGDGGFQGFTMDIAAAMAKAGYDVYGFDTKHYLESFTTDTSTLKEEDVQHDLGEVAKWMQTRWRERVTLVGWSTGAGFAVLAAASPDNRALFNGVVTFGLSNTAELGWRLRDDVTYITGADPDEPMFRTNGYIPKVAPLPLYMIQSTGDQFISKEEAEGLFAAAQQPKLYKSVPARNHAFDGNAEALFQALGEGLAWVNQTA